MEDFMKHCGHKEVLIKVMGKWTILNFVHFVLI